MKQDNHPLVEPGQELDDVRKFISRPSPIQGDPVKNHSREVNCTAINSAVRGRE